MPALSFFAKSQYTIDGINWFADLLHEAEVEYYAHTYYQTEVWKPVYQALIREEERENVIVDLCKAKNEPIPPLILPRRRIKTEKDLKKFQSLVCQWLSNFIEDENNNIYLQQGTNLFIIIIEASALYSADICRGAI